jgi:hypothetical protein
MADFLDYWSSLNPRERIDMSEFYHVYFYQEIYLEGSIWQS